MTVITYECPNCHWHSGHAENCPSWHEQPRPEQAGGETHQVLIKGPDGFPCYCRCHVTVTVRQQTCIHCDSYQAYPAEGDAPAAPEQPVTWLSVNMTEDSCDPRFTIEESNKLLATVYDAATAAQIVTEHNQHSTLIAQRERLIEALQRWIDAPKCARTDCCGDRGYHDALLFNAKQAIEFARPTTGRKG